MTAPEDRQTVSSTESAEPVANQPSGGDLSATLNWLRDISELGSILSRLAIAEIGLAAGDAARCLVLVFVALPIVWLAWVGLCVLISWFGYSLSGYPGVGFATFFLLQLVTLLFIAYLLSKYRKSIGLPETRAQLKGLFEDVGYGKKGTGS